jgi:integrase
MAIKSYSARGKKLFEVYVNGFDIRGRRVQMRKRGVNSIKKARDLEFEFERDLALAKESEVRLRWSEWFIDCLNLIKISHKPSTVYTFEKICGKWIHKHLDSKELRSISKTDIHEILYEKMTDDIATQHTRKQVLKILKRIFQLAIDNGKLERNPCQGMTVKVPESDMKVLTNSEAQTLLSQAKLTNHRFYPVWLVALFTGMRSGELISLKWSDIDFDTGQISVVRSWNSKNGYTSTKSQKTRIVPMSDELVLFLKQLKVTRGLEEFVLPQLSEWKRGDAAYVLKDFCKCLKITEIRFHDLRATFITNLLARGTPLVQVMAIVGHSDMETTNVYVRKAGIEIQGATEKLGYNVPREVTGAKILDLVR